MTPKVEKLSGLLQESRLIVETGRLSRDFEPLRRAIRIAVGRDFGMMLVTLGFTLEREPGAALACRQVQGLRKDERGGVPGER